MLNRSTSLVIGAGLLLLSGAATAGNIAWADLDSWAHPDPSISNDPHDEMSDFRWQDGIIPYLIDSSFTYDEHMRIRAAMDTWQSETGGAISFVSVSGSPPTQYLFISDTNGCKSDTIGSYLFTGSSRTVHIGDGSTSTGGCVNNSLDILHELGHAIGLIHEHQRVDRNNYVIFDKDHLRKDPSTGMPNWHTDTVNFVVASTWTYGGRPVGDYDFRSIMHYGTHSRAANNSPLDATTATLWPVDYFSLTFDPTNIGYIADGTGIQQSDIDTVNVMYNRTILRNEGSDMCLKSFVLRTSDQPYGSLNAWFTKHLLDEWLWDEFVPERPYQDYYVEEYTIDLGDGQTVTHEFPVNKIYLSDCTGKQYNQEWVASPGDESNHRAAKLIAANGSCLTEQIGDDFPTGSPANKYYTLQWCDERLNFKQEFTYDPSTKLLKNADGHCLTSTVWSTFGKHNLISYHDMLAGGVTGPEANILYPHPICDPNAPYHRWEAIPAPF